MVHLKGLVQQFLLLVLCTQSVGAFVYSCEEVRYKVSRKLINCYNRLTLTLLPGLSPIRVEKAWKSIPGRVQSQRSQGNSRCGMPIFADTTQPSDHQHKLLEEYNIRMRCCTRKSTFILNTSIFEKKIVIILFSLTTGMN